MRVKISSHLPSSAGHVWALVKRSSTLHYVAKGFVGFVSSKGFPYEWNEGETVIVRLRFFGFIPAWKHHIRFQKVSDAERTLCTNEGGGMIRVWNHIIKVEEITDRSCYYTDDLKIKAVVFMPFVWFYVHIYYRYRQLRWRLLIKKEGI